LFRSRDIEIIIRPDTRIKDLKDDTTTTPPIKSDDNPPADRNLVKEKKPRFTGVRQRSREDRKNILFPPRINKAPGRITFPRGSKIADRNVKSNNDDNNSENEISEEDVDDFKVQEKDSGLRKKVKFPNFETGITGIILTTKITFTEANNLEFFGSQNFAHCNKIKLLKNNLLRFSDSTNILHLTENGKKI